jgi:hypothetical protein
LVSLNFGIGGCRTTTMEATAYERNEQEVILQRLKESVNLTADRVNVEKINIPALPGGYRVFRATDKNSNRNIYYNFVFTDKGTFSSLPPGELGALLKAEDYLGKRNLNGEQLVVLFRLLTQASMGMKDVKILNSIDDTAFKDSFKNFAGQVKPPAASEKNGGAELVFWSFNLRPHALQKTTVTVTKDYTVTSNTEEVARADK